MAFKSDFPMILFFGKQGQLARSFQATLPIHLQERSVFVSSQEANFEKPEHLPGFLDHYSPRIVVICSAYTQVDKAEEDKEVAEKINVQSPLQIAKWCQQNDAHLIFFSTDYVFSGEGQKAWVESDEAKPQNWYGETKANGEKAIQDSGCHYFIFRTSWVYSEYGKNFVKTMLQLGKSRDSLRVVGDQVGGPTYAPDLAEAVWKIIEQLIAGQKFQKGIYHICGRGEASWFQFAEAIFRLARQLNFELRVQQVEPISTTEYQTLANRPLNSRLDQSKLKKVFGLEMPNWENSLELCLKRIGPL